MACFRRTRLVFTLLASAAALAPLHLHADFAQFWSAIGAVPGSSAEIQSYEPIFQQDLNADGLIGQHSTVAFAPDHPALIFPGLI